ncbi:MAG: GAF domain-containing protein [Chloroflexota bacterium]
MTQSTEKQKGTKKVGLQYSLPTTVSQALDDVIYSSQDSQQVLNFILDTILNHLGAEYGSLRWVSYLSGKLQLKAVRLRNEQSMIAANQQEIDLDSNTIVAEVARTQQPRLITDLNQKLFPAEYHPLDPKVPMRSELAVPILSSDGKATAGVLNVESPLPRAFNDQDQANLVAFAKRVQIVIRRTQLSEAIQKIGENVLAENQNELFRCIVEELCELVQVRACSIWLYNDQSEELVLKKTVGRLEPEIDSLDSRLPLDSYVGQAIRKRMPVSSPRLQEEPKLLCLDMIKDLNWISALVVPILDGADQPLGVISVYSVGQERHFTKYDQDLVSVFANHVAIAIKQNHLLQEKEKNLHVVSGLQKISSELATYIDQDRLLNTIVEQTSDLLNSDSAILYLLNESINQHIIAAAVGPAKAVLGMHASPTGSLSGWVASNNQPVITHNQDERIDQEIAKHIGFKTVAAVPLSSETGAIGALVVLNKCNGDAHFDRDDLNLLRTLADQATVAMMKMQSFRQMERRSTQLRLVNEILAKSLSAVDVNTLLKETALQISQEFGYRVDIPLLESDRLIFNASVLHGAKKNREPRIFSVTTGITGFAARTGETVREPDVSKNPYYHTSSPETQSELAIPLATKERGCIGVLNIESIELGAFSKDDQQTFEAIATGITMAIENAQSTKERTALYKVATAVSQAQNLEQVNRSIVVTVKDLFTASACTLFLADPDSQELILAMEEGLAERHRKRIQRLKYGESIAGKVMQSGESIYIRDAQTDPRVDRTITQGEDVHSLIGVPIWSDSDCLAVLCVLTQQQRLFTEHDRGILEAIGHNVGIAIKNTQLNQKVVTAEKRYQRLYEGARDAIFILDENRIIRGANKEASRMTGYHREELMGRDMSTLVIDSQQREEVQRRIANLAQGGEEALLEIEINHKQNRAIPIEANPSSVRSEDGNILFIQTIWRDITTRKEHEAEIQQHNQQLNTLLEISRTAFRYSERHELLNWITEQAKQFMGSDDCTIHLLSDGLDSAKSFAVNPSSAFQQCVASSIKLKKGVIHRVITEGNAKVVKDFHSTIDFNHLSVLPELTPQHLLVVPMRSNRRVLGIICVARFPRYAEDPNYTQADQERLESLANILTLYLENIRLVDTQHTQWAAHKVLKEMSLLGAFLSHKMGGFLGAIGLNIGELKTLIQSTDDNIIETISALEHENKTAIHIVDQIRRMGRMTTQKQDLIQLKSVLQEAIQCVELPPHIIVKMCKGDIPPALADRALLIDIFSNIVKNSVQSMPSGGQLTINWRTTPDRYGTELSFVDTGHGMSQRVLNDVFTPFFTTKQAGRGLGIGMWLSKLYLQTLGGSIEIESEPHHGTTVTVRIPTTQDRTFRADVLSASSGASLEVKGDDYDFKTPVVKILVVDDYFNFQDTIRRMLHNRGHHVDTAQSYQETISILQRGKYDFFVIDVRLVDHDQQNRQGLDIAQHVLTQNPHAGILILSAYEESIESAQRLFRSWSNVVVLNKTDLEAIGSVFDQLPRNFENGREPEKR